MTAGHEEEGEDRPESDPARLLGLVYGFFTLAAGARSGVQLATQASVAPVAYGLSAAAALVYLAGTVFVARGDRRRARALAIAELTGVVVVGTVSYLVPSAFPDATVWSHFGSGYAFVPLVLPLAALVWAGWRRSPRNQESAVD